MLKLEWSKPQSDFTIYKDLSTLKHLVSTGAANTAKTNTLTDDIAGQEYRGPNAATAGPFRFDETVYFAWPLQLKGRHEFLGKALELRERLFVIYRARSLVCPCYNRSLCSITLRLDDEAAPQLVVQKHDAGGKTSFVGIDFENPQDSADRTLWSEVIETGLPPAMEPFIGIVRKEWLLMKPWKYAVVPGAPKDETLLSDPPFLFSSTAIARALFPAIYRPSSEHELDAANPVIKHGLIIISGQTGTLKSTILRELLQEYLRSFNFAAWGKRRYPHIVTIEDPIEKPIVPLDRKNVEPYLNHADQFNINFTPRQIGLDVESLKKGLHDALRQTPTAVIVGETRDQRSWIGLLRFASTGHLCFTTTHAGSLVETLRTIIEATGSTTPDLRSSLVEKIVAVVHLRSFDLRSACGQTSNDGAELGPYESMLLPAIWRNVNGGANFFVSDGLSAILPRRAEGQNGRPPSSCRGRADFARVMLTFLPRELSDRVGLRVRRIATRSDLEGV
jgi:hypothetical protein